VESVAHPSGQAKKGKEESGAMTTCADTRSLCFLHLPILLIRPSYTWGKKKKRKAAPSLPTRQSLIQQHAHVKNREGGERKERKGPIIMKGCPTCERWMSSSLSHAVLPGGKQEGGRKKKRGREQRKCALPLHLEY